MTTNALEQAKELLGEAKPVTLQPRKQTIMQMKDGGYFVALKAVSYYNKETQDYDKPVPRAVFFVDGKNIRLPFDPNLFENLSLIFGKMADFSKKINYTGTYMMEEDKLNDFLKAFGGKS